jgi:hypothetical protein
MDVAGMRSRYVPDHHSSGTCDGQRPLCEHCDLPTCPWPASHERGKRGGKLLLRLGVFAHDAPKLRETFNLQKAGRPPRFVPWQHWPVLGVHAKTTSAL